MTETKGLAVSAIVVSVSLAEGTARDPPQGPLDLKGTPTASLSVVVDAQEGTARRSVAVRGPTDRDSRIALSPDQKWLAVSSPSARQVGIDNFASGRRCYLVPGSEAIAFWLAWHATEPRLAIARDDGDVTIWDLDRVEKQCGEPGLGLGTES